MHQHETGVQKILVYPKDILCSKGVLPYVEIQVQALSMRVINQVKCNDNIALLIYFFFVFHGVLNCLSVLYLSLSNG